MARASRYHSRTRMTRRISALPAGHRRALRKDASVFGFFFDLPSFSTQPGTDMTTLKTPVLIIGGGATGAGLLQFLRNLCGLAALAGLGLMALLRLADRGIRSLSRVQDWALVGIVGALLASGFFLEAAKIVSPGEFTRMADEYFPEAEPAELVALQALWARENGVRFERFLPSAPEILALGRELHEDRCASCHAPTATAFVSRGLADLLPVAVRRAVALQACTRCGQCSLHCSVAPSHRVMGNRDILPWTSWTTCAAT